MVTLSMIAAAMLPLLSCPCFLPALPLPSGTWMVPNVEGNSHSLKAGGAALQGHHIGRQQRHVYSSGRAWRSQAPQRKSG